MVNMPHLEYFVVSQSISVDQYKNRVSIFHIYEEISYKSFPTYIALLAITTLWDIDEDERDKEFSGEIVLSPPSSNELVKHPFNFRTDKVAPRQRVILELRRVAVPAAGEFKFEVFLAGTRHAGHTIHIRKSEGHSSEPPDPTP
jgi:hypothetical protein